MHPRSRRRSRLQLAITIFGIFAFSASAFAAITTVRTNEYAQEQLGVLGESIKVDEHGVAEGSGESPAEAPVSESVVRQYSPPSPELPRHIKIPKLGVFARIKPLGQTAAGAIDAPWNVHDAGWYRESVMPGSEYGTSLILGHVSGWTTAGVFKKLAQLENGDTFDIVKGSGETLTYEITNNISVAVEQINMSDVLTPSDGQVHDLKLMTCSGAYDAATDSYKERRIVTAVRKS